MCGSDVRKTNGCSGGGLAAMGAGAGLPVGAGKKKACKLILENPHGGILVKHARASRLHAGADARFSHWRGATAALAPHLCRKTSDLWLQLEPRARRLVQISTGFQVKTASSWPCGSCSAGLLQFASSPRAALGWGWEAELSPANRQTLLRRGLEATLPSLLILLRGAGSRWVPNPRAGAVSCAPRECRDRCCGRGCCCGKWEERAGLGKKPAGFCN